jgi:hypothetical protein
VRPLRLELAEEDACIVEDVALLVGVDAREGAEAEGGDGGEDRRGLGRAAQERPAIDGRMAADAAAATAANTNPPAHRKCPLPAIRLFETDVDQRARSTTPAVDQR